MQKPKGAFGALGIPDGLGMGALPCGQGLLLQPPCSRVFSAPTPLPDGGDSEAEEHCSCFTTNYQPGQALPLTVASQRFARQLLNQQAQAPGRGEPPL